MKKYSLLLTFLGPLAISGCASTFGDQGAFKKINAISEGAPTSQVKKELGSPQHSESKNNKTAWQYCKANILGGMNDYIIVWFHEDRYVGHENYSRSENLMCIGTPPKISWSAFPDKNPE